jgi:hypothetical protein
MINQFIRTNQKIINFNDLFSQLIDESRQLKSKINKEIALNSKVNSRQTNPNKDKFKKLKRLTTITRYQGIQKINIKKNIQH